MSPSRVSTKTFLLRLYKLFRRPVFIWFTIWGNSFVLLSAFLFYSAEHKVNPSATSFLDCLAWAVGMVTTIGFGPIAPVTATGKILSILVMVAGALFLWTYMALFVSALVSPELNVVESEIKEIESEITEIQKEIKLDDHTEKQLVRLVSELNSLLKQIIKRS